MPVLNKANCISILRVHDSKNGPGDADVVMEEFYPAQPQSLHELSGTKPADYFQRPRADTVPNTPQKDSEKSDELKNHGKWKSRDDWRKESERLSTILNELKGSSRRPSHHETSEQRKGALEHASESKQHTRDRGLDDRNKTLSSASSFHDKLPQQDQAVTDERVKSLSAAAADMKEEVEESRKQKKELEDKLRLKEVAIAQLQGKLSCQEERMTSDRLEAQQDVAWLSGKLQTISQAGSSTGSPMTTPRRMDGPSSQDRDLRSVASQLSSAFDNPTPPTTRKIRPIESNLDPDSETKIVELSAEIVREKEEKKKMKALLSDNQTRLQQEGAVRKGMESLIADLTKQLETAVSGDSFACAQSEGAGYKDIAGAGRVTCGWRVCTVVLFSVFVGAMMGYAVHFGSSWPEPAREVLESEVQGYQPCSCESGPFALSQCAYEMQANSEASSKETEQKSSEMNSLKDELKTLLETVWRLEKESLSLLSDKQEAHNRLDQAMAEMDKGRLEIECAKFEAEQSRIDIARITHENEQMETAEERASDRSMAAVKRAAEEKETLTRQAHELEEEKQELDQQVNQLNEEVKKEQGARQEAEAMTTGCQRALKEQKACAHEGAAITRMKEAVKEMESMRGLKLQALEDAVICSTSLAQSNTAKDQFERQMLRVKQDLKACKTDSATLHEQLKSANLVAEETEKATQLVVIKNEQYHQLLSESNTLVISLKAGIAKEAKRGEALLVKEKACQGQVSSKAEELKKSKEKIQQEKKELQDCRNGCLNKAQMHALSYTNAVTREKDECSEQLERETLRRKLLGEAMDSCEGRFEEVKKDLAERERVSHNAKARSMDISDHLEAARAARDLCDEYEGQRLVSILKLPREEQDCLFMPLQPEKVLGSLRESCTTATNKVLEKAAAYRERNESSGKFQVGSLFKKASAALKWFQRGHGGGQTDGPGNVATPPATTWIKGSEDPAFEASVETGLDGLSAGEVHAMV